MGLHSAETSPPEMLMELIYRLATEDSPLIEEIRKNVIVMTFAVSEPDGRDRYVDWYYKYKTSEETEADSAGGPPYWGKYIYHDNNRDINYSQVTMQNWLKFYLEWHPPIMHDLHESEPFLYTFSGQPPQNPTLDPILYAEMPWFSEYELTKMIAWGVPGVWTHAFVDMWSPGYLGFMSSNHNGMLRMYEIFGQWRREYDAAQCRRRRARRRGWRRRRRGRWRRCKPVERHRRRGGRAAAGPRGSGRRPRWTRRTQRRARRDDQPRMVSACASLSDSGLVDAKQHQLFGIGRAGGAGTDGEIPADHSGEFLSEELALDSIG